MEDKFKYDQNADFCNIEYDLAFDLVYDSASYVRDARMSFSNRREDVDKMKARIGFVPKDDVEIQKRAERYTTIV